jgi:hypothetical protein
MSTSTPNISPVDMIYLGTTEVKLGNDTFEFGATQLTGNTLLVVLALAGLGLGLYLFHKR